MQVSFVTDGDVYFQRITTYRSKNFSFKFLATINFKSKDIFWVSIKKPSCAREFHYYWRWKSWLINECFGIQIRNLNQGSGAFTPTPNIWIRSVISTQMIHFGCRMIKNVWVWRHHCRDLASSMEVQSVFSFREFPYPIVKEKWQVYRKM
jgi:hypothetical protein